MDKLTQPLMLLMILYPAIAYTGTARPSKSNELSSTINLNFATGPGEPSRVVLNNKYCMKGVPDVIGLDNGSVSFDVLTDSNILSKCGWVHSSATFEVLDINKKRLLEFEFYSPWSTGPYLEITWPSPAPKVCEIDNGLVVNQRYTPSSLQPHAPENPEISRPSANDHPLSLKCGPLSSGAN